MKKIMIIAVAAIMAGVANAASVNWSSGTVYNPNNTESKIGKQTGDWIMTVAFYTDAAGQTAFAAGGDLSDNSTLATSKFGGEATGFDLGKTYYVQAIITDKAGNWSIDTGVVAFTTQSTGNSDIAFDDGSGLKAGSAWNTQSIGTTGDLGKWVAVPEPTSGLLLLIGMAGLALRRRRA